MAYVRALFLLSSLAVLVLCSSAADRPTYASGGDTVADRVFGQGGSFTTNTNTCSLGDACDDDDDDNDEVFDLDEGPCGADALNADRVPERLDTPGDDDGDTVTNEGLPSPVSDAFDCDGDGWRGNQENLIYGDAPSTARDQDPCGSNGWPSELAGNNNTVNITDLNSFLQPLRIDGSFNKFNHVLDDNGDTVIDAAMARWNLQTPPHLAGTAINIGDLNALITGAVGSPARPPMFAGQPAFFTGGGVCPYAP